MLPCSLLPFLSAFLGGGSCVLVIFASLAPNREYLAYLLSIPEASRSCAQSEGGGGEGCIIGSRLLGPCGPQTAASIQIPNPLGWEGGGVVKTDPWVFPSPRPRQVQVVPENAPNPFPADATGPGTTVETGCTSIMFTWQQRVPPLPLSLSFRGLRAEVLLRRN